MHSQGYGGYRVQGLQGLGVIGFRVIGFRAYRV